jgi:hypothetical protein
MPSAHRPDDVDRARRAHRRRPAGPAADELVSHLGLDPASANLVHGNVDRSHQRHWLRRCPQVARRGSSRLGLDDRPWMLAEPESAPVRDQEPLQWLWPASSRSYPGTCSTTGRTSLAVGRPDARTVRDVGRAAGSPSRKGQSKPMAAYPDPRVEWEVLGQVEADYVVLVEERAYGRGRRQRGATQCLEAGCAVERNPALCPSPRVDRVQSDDTPTTSAQKELDLDAFMVTRRPQRHIRPSWPHLPLRPTRATGVRRTARRSTWARCSSGGSGLRLPGPR